MTSEELKPSQPGQDDFATRFRATQSDDDLFSSIGRRVPMAPPEIRQGKPIKLTPAMRQRGVTQKHLDIGKMGQERILADMQEKKDAYDELIKRGHDPEDIKFAIDVQNRVDPIIPRGTGKLVGEIAGGLIAGQLIPGPIDDAAILMRILSSTGRGAVTAGGAVAGETAESVARGEGLPSGEQLAETGIRAGAEQVGGEGVMAGGRFLLKHSPLVKKVAPTSAKALDAFREAGGIPTPSSQDRRLFVQAGESLSRGSIGGANKFAELDASNQEVLRSMATAVVDDILKGVDKLPDADVGRMISDMTQQPFGTRWTMVDDLISPMYEEIDGLAKFGIEDIVKTTQEIIPGEVNTITGEPLTKAVRTIVGQKQTGAVVKTSSMRKFANDLLAKNKLTIREGAEGAQGAILTPAGVSELQRIANLPDEVGFGVMSDVRSSLLKKGRQLAFEKSADAGIVRKLGGLSREALFDPALARKVPPEARKLLEDTTALYKQASTKFEQSFSKTMTKRIARNPAKAAKSMINTNDAESLRNAKEIISGRPIVRAGKIVFIPDTEGKEAWRQVAGGHLANLIEENKSISKAVDKLNKLDPGVRSLLYDDAYMKRLNQVKTLDDAVSSKPPSASILAKSLQFGGGLGIGQIPGAGNIAVGIGGMISMASPIVYAEVASSPKLHRLLVAGMKAPPRTKQKAIAVAKLIRGYTQFKEQKAKIEADKATPAGKIIAARRRGVAEKGNGSYTFNK